MNNAPPKSARFLLKLLCDPHFHEEVEGDLDELFEHNLESFGLKKARRRYWGDVFKHFNWYFITRRNTSGNSQNIFDMWTNYLKIAFRNMTKNKGYTAMNIMGLGVGMACAVLILVYSLHELSFDRFHEKANRTYVAHSTFTPANLTVSSTPSALSPSLQAEFPEVEAGVRFQSRGAFNAYTVQYKENVFKEVDLFYVDSTFFKVFSFELLAGNPETCLNQPYSIVLTEEMASKYFGQEDPMGKVLKIDNRRDYQVTGVLKDIPSNSHIQFDFLTSYTSLTSNFFKIPRWNSASFTTYLVLKEGVKPEDVEAKIPDLVKRSTDEEGLPEYTLEPLLDIHLSSLGVDFDPQPQNEMKYLYIFGFIGILILSIASINYTNLATARAVFRAKEIGMRKVMGAYRHNLFYQFMSESLLIVFISALLAIVLAMLTIPYFNALADRQFVIADLWQFEPIAGVLLIALFVGLLAGIYPAIVLSGFRPITVLKGSFKNSKSGVVVRKFLVTGQFVISISLIIGTVVVFEQLSYMQNKDLGYNNQNVVLLPLTSGIRKNYPAFKAEMLREPGVLDMTLSSESPTKIDAGYSMILKDVDVEKEVMVAGLRTDIDFLDAFQMKLISGTFMTDVDAKSVASDLPFDEKTFGFVLNEQALAEFDLSAEEIIGKRAFMNGRNGVIRGVVQDFHFESLREKIKPMVFMSDQDFNSVLVRISGQNVENTISKIQARWRRIAPNVPFEYDFIENEYNALYSAESKLSKLFGVFAILGIFIACFGLLGLISFATIQKAREIGVRKVLGASVSSLVLLLNRDFAKLVLIAFVISVPLAFFTMNGWLRSFEYRISIGFVPVVLALLMTSLIAFLTISIQSMRAAVANPVDVLKEE
ncbi:ABC transporter permease [Roseivirga sp. E12]|uniref:ABC transporter permease n=1 Tax=Roseivirga sp. E12 TaxID=2819237 RepID=UPI001ABC0DF8|nr:ABC transporter permease [Roseivirga sp. E12]MBO3700420.1 ABC transporter permease [Roseivirga sp. E12]